MNYNYIFQDNLQVLVWQNGSDLAIPDTIISDDLSYYLGNHCLTKFQEKWIAGRVLLEDDKTFQSAVDMSQFNILQFPIADYFFTSGKIMRSEILALEKDSIKFLEQSKIGNQDYSIVVFPHGMPVNNDELVLAEFWLATDSDTKTNRLSDQLPEIMGKKSFDFFRS